MTAELRLPPEVRLRPETEADLPFLRELYASTREEELAPTGWSAEQRRAFTDWQFEAQRQHYRHHYDDTTFDIIEVGGQPAGRLYLARWPEELRIVDIALLPAFRGRGTGTALLRGIQEEAAATGRRVTIHVEQLNPARRLYERLGFRQIGETGVYLLLEWRAVT